MEVNEIVSSARNVYSQDQYAMYLRKSRADMELEAMGEGETLARHKKMLDALAAKHDIHPDQITVYREVVSGDSISERPEMQKLLKDVYAKTYKGVLVVEVERLARGNTKDQGEVADAFQYSSTHIITPAKVYDPNNESDQEYFEFGLFMSRREYKTIRRRLEAGRLQSVKEGNFIGTGVPFGFDVVKKSKKERILVENPEDSRIVKMIFDWFTEERINPGVIAKRLTTMGIKTPTGLKDWNRSTVKDILQNVHYIGKVRWKHRELQKDFVDGKLVKVSKRNDHEQSQVFEGKHEGFISEEQFYKARDLFSEFVPLPICKEISNPLAGLIFCSTCGKAIRINHYHERNTEARYVHINLTDCRKKSASVPVIHDALVDVLNAYINDFSIKMNNNYHQDERIKHLEMIQAMETELSKQERKRDRLFDSFEDGVYTREEFIERKQRYNHSIEELKKQIQEVKEACPEPVNYEEQIENLHAIIKCIKDPELNGKAKNDFLKRFIDRITYDIIDYGAGKGGKPILEVFLK